MEKLSSWQIQDLSDFLSSYNFEDLKCPVTGKRIVAVCVNPKAPRKTLCSSCLLNDPDFIRKFRNDLLPIEDVRQKLDEGLKTFESSDPAEVLDDLKKIKQKVKEAMLKTIDSDFDTCFEKGTKEFQKALDEKLSAAPPEQADSESEPQTMSWLSKGSESLKTELGDPTTAASCIIGLFNELSSNGLVRAKLAASEIISYPSKELETKSEAVSKEVQRVVQAVMFRMITSLEVFPPFDRSCVMKRWATLNQAYNYQNTLNSLCFMVSEETLFYGYSQYFTTGVPIETRFRLVEGDTAAGKDIVLEFTLTIRPENQGQPERTVDNINQRTFPVFFDKPVMLKPQVWYNISFLKPGQSHYIYYGSSPTSGNGERFNYSDGKKSINFRRAADDTIDNSHSLGQFPDFYLR
jgi:PHR domain